MKTVRRNIVTLGLVASLVAAPNAAYAISESTAKFGSVAIGAVAGVGTGTITYCALSEMNTAGKIAIATLAGATVGGLSWWSAYHFLHSMTPEGRFVAAQQLISLVELDPVINREIFSLEDFKGQLSVRFGTSWPLVRARNHLITRSNNILEAQNLLNSCIREASADSMLGNLVDQAQKLRSKIPALVGAIEERMALITQNYDYKDQVRLYENHLEEERRREHISKEKQLDRLHTSYEKHSDRAQDSYHKDANRDLKKIAMQRVPAHNAALNVNI